MTRQDKDQRKLKPTQPPQQGQPKLRLVVNNQAPVAERPAPKSLFAQAMQDFADELAKEIDLLMKM